MESLWWAMHQSGRSRKTALITCYLDESGTDDRSPTAVVGGILLHRKAFLKFNPQWKALLKKHQIPSVHMKDFQRHGKLGQLSAERQEHIFFDVAALVNKYKSISIGATLSTSDYSRYFAGVFDKEVMSLYGMCFILAAVVNHKAAENSAHKKKIPFLMDDGNVYKHHVLDAHSTALQFQKHKFLNLGSLSVGDDEFVLPLQAADVVSWSVRRRLTKQFGKGFEPLQNIFDAHHVEKSFSAEFMTELAESLRSKIRAKLEP